jgi:CRISPR/Cas system CMR-associated protein Cmr1 (group 7 of RAMP superfamily)
VVLDDDYICETNLIALSNENKEKKPVRTNRKMNKIIKVNNDNFITIDENDYICETNLFTLSNKKSKPQFRSK